MKNIKNRMKEIELAMGNIQHDLKNELNFDIRSEKIKKMSNLDKEYNELMKELLKK